MLIVEYQPRWIEDFNKIREVLSGGVSHDITIEHIGSTAVEGLPAKSIIDIDIVYKNSDEFSAIANDLAILGYAHVGNQGIDGREVFKRKQANHTVLDGIQHHLYLCHTDNKELSRHLAFRDKLKESKELMHEYAALKYKIAKMADQDKKEYARLKELLVSDFIESVLIL